VGGWKILVMKKEHKHSSQSSARPQPLEEDPFYGHSGWVVAEMKRMVSQEERRDSQHRGKTIRRPVHVGRTMGS
jgi:hypothetical protein